MLIASNQILHFNGGDKSVLNFSVSILHDVIKVRHVEKRLLGDGVVHEGDVVLVVVVVVLNVLHHHPVTLLKMWKLCL